MFDLLLSCYFSVNVSKNKKKQLQPLLTTVPNLKISRKLLYMDVLARVGKGGKVNTGTKSYQERE